MPRSKSCSISRVPAAECLAVAQADGAGLMLDMARAAASLMRRNWRSTCNAPIGSDGSFRRLRDGCLRRPCWPPDRGTPDVPAENEPPASAPAGAPALPMCLSPAWITLGDGLRHQRVLSIVMGI